MSLFYTILTFDNTGHLLPKFLALSRSFRKHLLWHIFHDELAVITERFKARYGQVMAIEEKWISMKPMSFCNEQGMKMDLGLKVRMRAEVRKLEGRSVIIGC